MDEPLRTAAAVIIGNELLSGKVQESNLVVLARALRSIGVQLRRVVFLLDQIDEIAAEVQRLSKSHDWLFTSGGVGPTHDDVTVAAVAQAFSVPIVSDAVLVHMLRAYYGDRYTASHAHMALIPEGAVLERNESVQWPVIRMGNCWLLPGIPEVFRMKMSIVTEKLGRHRPFVSESVYTLLEEGELKPLLDQIVREFPDIEVGSYPKWMHSSYKTRLTFDGKDPERVASARDAFVQLLPKGEPQEIQEHDLI